jgi:hypothetical protein
MNEPTANRQTLSSRAYACKSMSAKDIACMEGSQLPTFVQTQAMATTERTAEDAQGASTALAHHILNASDTSQNLFNIYTLIRLRAVNIGSNLG